VCLAAPVAVQAQGDYLDVYIVKVKPEKLADFQALTKKWADANHRYNGDRWLALQAVYGEGNIYQFTSTRKDYADIDKTNEAVMAAVNKAFGKEAGQKMEQDFNSCVVPRRTPPPPLGPQSQGPPGPRSLRQIHWRVPPLAYHCRAHSSRTRPRFRGSFQGNEGSRRKEP
jgi:hypothetical protein